MYQAQKRFKELELPDKFQGVLSLGYTPVANDEYGTVLWFKRFRNKDYNGTLLVTNFQENGEVFNSITLNMSMYHLIVWYGVHQNLNDFVPYNNFTSNDAALIEKMKKRACLKPYRTQGYKVLYAHKMTAIGFKNKMQYTVALYRELGNNLYLKIVTFRDSDILKDDEVWLSGERALELVNAFASTQEFIDTNPDIYLTPEQRDKKNLLSERDIFLYSVLGEIDTVWLDALDDGSKVIKDEYYLRLHRTHLWELGALDDYEKELKKLNQPETTNTAGAYLHGLAQKAAEKLDETNQELEHTLSARKELN